jgi:hypothetical protein
MHNNLLWLAAFVAGTSFAASIEFPDGALTVSGTSAGGASIVYAGTLTQNDTIAFAQTGNPCLQPGSGYCTNGAGVVTVAGTLGAPPFPVGGSSTFVGPTGIIPAGTWTYGALLMTISGAGTVQVFPADAGNGLGNASPPAGLNLPPTPLGALGFGNFSQVNPTITFIVADGYFGDNDGKFVLSQARSTDASDIWWNRDESGWAMQLTNTGTFAFVTVYVYGPDGKPTWVTGELKLGPNATFTGPLYVNDAGPWFGGQWNSAAVTQRQAGTMTFVLTSATTGQITYSVDGVVVDKAVERTPITLDDHSGNYRAVDARTATGCLDNANNGASVNTATIQITQAGPTMSAVWTLANADVCTHTGTYAQAGRMGTFAASYTCTSGEVGTAAYSEMTSSFGVLRARLETHSTTLGCTTKGRLSGVVPD